MSLFDDYNDAANAALTTVFADTIDLMISGGPAHTNIPAVLETQPAMELRIPGQSAVFGVVIKDLPTGVFPKVGDRVMFNDVPYTIGEIETDEGGMAHLICRSEFLEPRG